MQAILLALDRKEREREMVSVLLAELHPRELSEQEIGEGFTAIMLSCEVAPCSSSACQHGLGVPIHMRDGGSDHAQA